MIAGLRSLYREQSGGLSFEWILLASMLAIAMIAGIANLRDAFINELGDVATAVSLVNQSFTVSGKRPAGFLDLRKGPDQTLTH